MELGRLESGGHASIDICESNKHMRVMLQILNVSHPYHSTHSHFPGFFFPARLTDDGPARAAHRGSRSDTGGVVPRGGGPRPFPLGVRVGT